MDSSNTNTEKTTEDFKFDYDNLFSPNNILDSVRRKVKKKDSVSIGLDLVGAKSFLNSLDKEMEIIQRKTADGTYSFTRYRMMLIPKGPEKKPRKICIPTIRDRIIIDLIAKYLKHKFPDATRTPTCREVISEFIKTRKNYAEFFKLDITTFFASVDHDLLIKKLKTRISDVKILNLIRKILKNSSFETELRKSDEENRTKGIPEGLSCSGILADIFLSDIDNTYKNRKDIAYFRFVDDILVLCHEGMISSVRNEITGDITALKMSLNDEKDNQGSLNKEFQYLGYVFNGDVISVRKQSVIKHEKAIENLIRQYSAAIRQYRKSYKSIPESLFYELTNKISIMCAGVIVDKKQMGWLSYYRHINDMKLLHRLDMLTKKLFKRFGLPAYVGKKHVRAFYEINRNIPNTNYIYRVIDTGRASINRTSLLDMLTKAGSFLLNDEARKSGLICRVNVSDTFFRTIHSKNNVQALQKEKCTDATANESVDSDTETDSMTDMEDQTKLQDSQKKIQSDETSETSEASEKQDIGVTATNAADTEVQDTKDLFADNGTPDSSFETDDISDDDSNIVEVLRQIRQKGEISIEDYILLAHCDGLSEKQLQLVSAELGINDHQELLRYLSENVIIEEFKNDPIVLDDLENVGEY